MTWRRARGGLMLLTALGAACAAHPSALPVARAPARAAPVPDLSPGPSKKPSPLASDALWRRAEAGDDIDLARLAHREGALGLLQGVKAGGTLALTALHALPDAGDAELALGPLCRMLRAGDARKLAPVIRAVQAIVAKPPLGVEQLDPEGMRSCAPVLSRLAKNPKLAPEERDFASSARAMLAEHGIQP